ncbi:MAG: HlyC/CorC family transporter [Bryobacterales bacterium]|nr:HlyC/CorC family transporter [Bryobacterales bacterium]
MISVLLLVVLALICGVIVIVSFMHLLCRESLRIKARDPESLDYYKEVLQEKTQMDGEQGALAYSLIRHFGLLAMTIVMMASSLDGDNPNIWLALLQAFGLASLLMLVTSYLIPTFLYNRTNGHWALAAIPLLRLLALLARPVIGALELVQDLADLGKQEQSQPEPTQEEHVEALIEAGKEEGILEEDDSQLIQSVVAFGDKTVREIMTPRPNIVAVDSGTTLEQLRQIVINEQYSRIPVYSGTIDNPVGFVHVRDMFEQDESQRATRTVVSIMRPIPFVPETKPVSALLREMQRDSVHMVAVVDEYGNIAGIATMEDLVEEIIGEVRDEHEPGVDAVPEGEDAYLVAGNFDLDNLKQLIDFTPLEATEATTVGGLVTEWLGHVPRPGETVQREGVEMQVIASDQRRVERVRIRKYRNGNS